MTSQQAQSVAQELGDILPNDEKLQAEIHRLNRKSFIPLEQVKMLHDWRLWLRLWALMLIG
jgi:hypothetical protein